MIEPVNFRGRISLNCIGRQATVGKANAIEALLWTLVQGSVHACKQAVQPLDLIA